MSIRDYNAFVAKQMGVDPGVTDNILRLESGYKADAWNRWDSNAQKGTPSRGPAQFIQPTMESFAAKARAANPDLWKDHKTTNWLDPRQQVLTLNWAIKNNLGSHWATFDRAKQAAPSYNYTPKFRLGAGAAPAQPKPVGVVPGVTPKPGVPKPAAKIPMMEMRPVDLSEEQHRQFALAGKDAAGLIRSVNSTRQQEVLAHNEKARIQNADIARQVDEVAKAQLPVSVTKPTGRTSSDAETQQRLKLVQTARAEVGNTAAQAMKYIRAAGGTGYEPWCGDYVQYVFAKNGLKPPPARSVPALLKWAQGNGTFTKTGKAGDLAMFDWDNDGNPDHVGMVAGGRGNGQYRTIEGNTSGNLGGSQVAEKNRASNILGFVSALGAR